MSAPLQQVPFTLDHDQAEQWLRDYAAAHIGVEGLVLKTVDEPYVAGVRRWSKLRSRDTTEVLVGAVTGPLQQPNRLILATCGSRRARSRSARGGSGCCWCWR